jgi:hypothetical protein
LEQLIKKEEELKEKEEFEELEKSNQQEQTKKEILMKTLESKKIEDQRNAEKAMLKQEIEKVQDEVKKKIQERRNALGSELLKMKLRSGLKKNKLNINIKKIRTEMLDDLQRSKKGGNMDACFNPSPSTAEKHRDYCQSNFLLNNQLKTFCDDPDQFCEVCCENEFGPFNPLRETCYKKCNGEISAGTEESGRWVYKLENDYKNKKE